MASGGKSIWSLLFGILGNFIETRDEYNKIKKNVDTRQESKVMGKKSIKCSIIGTILFCLATFCLIWGFSMLLSEYFIFGIVLVALGVGLVFYPAVYLILSLNYLIKQLCLNKKTIGFVSLFIFIVAICIIVIFAIFFLNFFG